MPLDGFGLGRGMERKEDNLLKKMEMGWRYGRWEEEKKLRNFGEKFERKQENVMETVNLEGNGKFCVFVRLL